jgi:hypothetical protein
MPARPAAWVARCSVCSRQRRTASSSRQNESDTSLPGWLKAQPAPGEPRVVLASEAANFQEGDAAARRRGHAGRRVRRNYMRVLKQAMAGSRR